MSSTIAPTVVTPPSSAPSPRSAMATIPSAPPEIVSLPAGTTVEAVVRAASSGGSGSSAVIETPYGTLTLKTPLPLPEGAQLLLQLTGSKGDNALLRLLSLDGNAIGRGLQNSLTPSLPSVGTSQTASLSSPSGMVASAGISMEATVLSSSAGLGNASPGAGQASPGLAMATLPPGSRLTVRLTGPAAGSGGQGLAAGGSLPHGAPSIGGGGTGQSPQGAAGSPLSSAASLSPASPHGNGGAPAPAGAILSGILAAKNGLAKAIAPLSGGEPSAASPSGSLPSTPGSPLGSSSLGSPSSAELLSSSPLRASPHLNGVVTAQNAGGRTIIQTPAGALALDRRLDIPPGTSVNLEVITHPSPPATALAGQPSAALTAPLFSSPATAAATAWPALSDTITLLQQVDPTAARQLLASIPGSNQALMANAISFTQAARTGDASKWPGEKVLSALERSGEKGRALAGRLKDDMQELGERTKRAPSGNGGEWRTLPMPFMDGSTIAQVTIVTRRPQTADDQPDSDSSAHKKDQGQRFLVDLSLSKLGDFQLDGLYKGKGRTFDLIIRTKSALPAELRQAIQGIFSQSSQALAIQGSIIFRVTDDFPGPTEAEVAKGARPTPSVDDDQTATVLAAPAGGWTA